MKWRKQVVVVSVLEGLSSFGMNHVVVGWALMIHEWQLLLGKPLFECRAGLSRTWKS